MILCPACNKATRVANKVEGGKKIRVCQKCGAALDVKAEKNDKKEKKTKTAAAESTGTSAKKTRKSKKTEEAQA